MMTDTWHAYGNKTRRPNLQLNQADSHTCHSGHMPVRLMQKPIECLIDVAATTDPPYTSLSKRAPCEHMPV